MSKHIMVPPWDGHGDIRDKFRSETKIWAAMDPKVSRLTNDAMIIHQFIYIVMKYFLSSQVGILTISPSNHVYK